MCRDIGRKFSLFFNSVRAAGCQGNTRRFTCKLQLVVRGRGFPVARARREQVRNLVPEIAMYPVGQVPAKVIKAFVLPVHCRSNLLRYVLHRISSIEWKFWNFESYSSLYSRRKFDRFFLYFPFFHGWIFLWTRLLLSLFFSLCFITDVD